LGRQPEGEQVRRPADTIFKEMLSGRKAEFEPLKSFSSPSFSGIYNEKRIC